MNSPGFGGYRPVAELGQSSIAIDLRRFGFGGVSLFVALSKRAELNHGEYHADEAQNECGATDYKQHVVIHCRGPLSPSV
jgi:hypothetical protein